jgi:hypothetical protein
MTRYKAKKGSRINDKEAQLIGTIIEEYSIKNNGISSEDIVNIAKPKTSKLHKYFTWDDKRAGKLYRIQEARALIASVQEIKIIRGKQKEQRSFFSVENNEGQQVYLHINKILKTNNYLQQLISEAQKYIKNFSDLLDMIYQEVGKK